MSSFQQNKFHSKLCSYCKQSYSIDSHSDQGTRCPHCRLWQHFAPTNLVSTRAKYSPKLVRRVFIISLDRDSYRWSRFCRGLMNPKIPIYTGGRAWAKFHGVDGENENAVDQCLVKFFGSSPPPSPVSKKKRKKKHKSTDIDKKTDSGYVRAQECRRRAKMLWSKKPGSIGCYLSHMSLWSHIQQTPQQGEEYVLIMEDDAYFPPFGLQNVDIMLAQAKKHNWDILYVGHNKLRGVKISKLFMRPRHPLPGEKIGGYNAGLWGYIVRVSSIPKLLSSVYNFDSYAIDDVLRHRFGEISALFCVPEMIHHTGTWISSRERSDGTLH